MLSICTRACRAARSRHNYVPTKTVKAKYSQIKAIESVKDPIMQQSRYSVHYSLENPEKLKFEARLGYNLNLKNSKWTELYSPEYLKEKVNIVRPSLEDRLRGVLKNFSSDELLLLRLNTYYQNAIFINKHFLPQVSNIPEKRYQILKKIFDVAATHSRETPFDCDVNDFEVFLDVQREKSLLKIIRELVNRELQAINFTGTDLTKELIARGLTFTDPTVSLRELIKDGIIKPSLENLSLEELTQITSQLGIK